MVILNMRMFSRFKNYPHSIIVSLPKPRSLSDPLSLIIDQRKSSWDFLHTTMDIQSLSDILYASCAIRGRRVNEQSSQTKGKEYRPYPSGGYKYPVEIYVSVVCSAAGLSQGIYHYRPDTHQLEEVIQLNQNDIHTLQKVFVGSFIPGVPLYIMFSCVLTRSKEKYGEQAYVLAMIEGGHICQSLLLAATSCAYVTNPLMPHQPDLFHQMIGLNSDEEYLFYALALGKKK